MKSYSKAIDDITKAIVLNINNSEFYHKRGELFRNLHQFEYAVADFTKAIELDKQSSNSFHERGVIYFRRVIEYD